MSMDFSLEFSGKYIHIVHAPDYEITPEGLKKLWTKLAQACQTYHCTKILAEGLSAQRQ